jgi:hypothetical protein
LRVLRDVQDREVLVHEAVDQCQEGERDEHALSLGNRARHHHPRVDAALRADQRKHGLDQREHQREDQAEMAEFWNHLP